MLRYLTISWVIVLGLLFGWGVPLLRLFDAFQPLVVALSIMVAAIFVRLNRGMPTLEWKSLEPVERQALTGMIVALSGEYALIVLVDALALCGLVALTVVGRSEIGHWSNNAQCLVSGLIGALIALSIARMAYVIWRDFDIVKLQKHLIDTSAQSEAVASQAKASNEKISDIRSAGLRKIASQEPKAWGD